MARKLETAVSFSALTDAWRELNTRATGVHRDVVGRDDESVNQFSQNSDHLLRGMSRDILRGVFQFSSLRPVLIPQEGKKDRMICVPTVRDRIIQGALQEHLEKNNRYGLDNGISFGFIRGKGVRKAAQAALALRAGAPFAYKADISSFFDSIPREALADRIKKRIREKSLRPLLIAASRCEIEHTFGRKRERITKLGIKEGVGVRQGMPLSPFFSNLFLAEFDRMIQDKGIKLVRYADDFIAFAQSRTECIEIHNLCRTELAKIKLTIHDLGPGSKTQIYEPTEPAEFLGVTIEPAGNGYALRISAEQLQAIKRELKKLSDIDELVNQRIDIASFFRKLSSAQAGYEGAYFFCDNIASLRDMLRDVEAYVVETLFCEGLGMKLGGLSPKQRAFLRLGPNAVPAVVKSNAATVTVPRPAVIPV